MDPIIEIARRNGLFVVEDACQAHGAEYKGRRVGAFGEAACFSFYPAKNLGAFGEAGAVVTHNSELQEKIRILRDHGQVQKYQHRMVGWNGRMDGIQAAVLQVKLRYLEQSNRLRRYHASNYQKALDDIEEIILPTQAAYARHVYHIYAIRVQDRDEILTFLADKGIGCGVHYPVPIHLQEAYRHLGYRRGAFPVAERCASEFVSLPMYPELTYSQVEEVIQDVKVAIAEGVKV
jgi:dTDP-4-amino-4,6-dideoxygalactose transaminase